MPTCQYHPSEPADRVCAPCLVSKLNSVSRRGSGIHRFVDHSSAGYYGSAAYYPDDDDLPNFSLHGIGFELEKRPGGAITATAAAAASSMLLRSDSHKESSSHRESTSSANAFFSCGSEISNRMSVDAHSDVDVKFVQAAATPGRKSDSRKCSRVEQSGLGATTTTTALVTSSYDPASGNEPSYPSAVPFNPPPYGVQSSWGSCPPWASCPASNVDIFLPCHHQSHLKHHRHAHPAASIPVPQHHHHSCPQPHAAQNQPQLSDRLCMSGVVRETDIKYTKPCISYFGGQRLAKTNVELRCDRNHTSGICLKTPVWKFKLFSRPSSVWRLKGSKVSPSKRDVDMEARGGRGSNKEVLAAGSAAPPVLRHNGNAQPDDSVRLWCPSPMVNFKERSFRWGKSDKGSASGRRSDGLEPQAMQAQEKHDQQGQSPRSGMFQRLYEFIHRRRTIGNRSETESNSSWHTAAFKAREVPPHRTRYDEEQAQLAANILSWMDGAADVAELPPQQEESLPASCSSMAAKTEKIPRLPDVAVNRNRRVGTAGRNADPGARDFGAMRYTRGNWHCPMLNRELDVETGEALLGSEPGTIMTNLEWYRYRCI
ncbi:hypothetical protein R1sor_019261 [Riccia sorocarpa]|uniref:Uncharacterized protein n=1 Tax=Riccia sorocarpa TaxID=122646 RepID=A0ABD3II83_9MARC